MNVKYLGAVAIAATLTVGTVACSPGGTDPCAGAEEQVDPCAADPCAGEADPCAADPCAGEADPCAADPCAGS
ncbi:MAG: hypothetical protein ACFBSF_20020 [Leptolyngbyaceae cyanobacterium]